ncbi:MAG: hypothetical protein IJ565_05650 [Bacilli bacterium]|nr:hypothetical protein [Bacilli bacterium]
MLNKVDELYNMNNLSNETIIRIIESKYLECIDPKSLKEAYKKTGIKISHSFIYYNTKLEVDMHSISYRDEKIGYTKYDTYKRRLISKLENKYNHKYARELENDIEVTTYVDGIYLERKNGLIRAIIIEKNNEEYELIPSKYLNEEVINDSKQI